jgi:hypothetical protein
MCADNAAGKLQLHLFYLIDYQKKGSYKIGFLASRIKSKTGSFYYYSFKVNVEVCPGHHLIYTDIPASRQSINRDIFHKCIFF